MKPEFDDRKTEGGAAGHRRWPIRDIIMKAGLKRRGHQYNPDLLILILYSSVQFRIMTR